jgi:hypothetical protein
MGLTFLLRFRFFATSQFVSNKFLKLLEELVKATSPELNFKTLRAKVHAAGPPLIPFPGVYQSDLLFLDTCAKGKLEGGLINFRKHQQIASYILELQVYQRTPYALEPVVEIMDYIRTFPVLDDEVAYNLSLQSEPRGS